MAATDAPTLLASANCYLSYASSGYMTQLMKLGLLKQILLASNPMAATDPQSLLTSANCYLSYASSPYALELMELGLLALIATNGGGGGGILSGAVDPTTAPSSTAAIYINTTSGRVWLYYNGTWN